MQEKHMKFRLTQLAFGGARLGVLLLVSIHGQLASISQLSLLQALQLLITSKLCEKSPGQTPVRWQLKR
jgi:hypothetical protein